MRRLRRARFAWTPLHARPTQVKRALGRTAAGRIVKRVGRTRTPAAPRRRPHPGAAASADILFVSHCDFTGNSAYHVHALARELSTLGRRVAVAAPSRRGLGELGGQAFPVYTYAEAAERRVDLVHAFTPRPHVRALVGAIGAPYLVHLEDNEAIASRASWRGDDEGESREFVTNAAAVTLIVERLRDLVPDGVRTAVWWPGFDEDVLATRPRAVVRRELGVDADTVLAAYTGNINAANLDDIRNLYAGLRAARHREPRIVLVRSGWSSVPRRELPRVREGVIDLGWIARRRVHELVASADVLVQPGAPGPFNDYRFPSKVPNFLASGNPVVLPRTNVGLVLEDRVQARVLAHGSADELGEALVELAQNPALRSELGREGRTFARRRLRWADAAAVVDRLHRELR